MQKISKNTFLFVKIVTSILLIIVLVNSIDFELSSANFGLLIYIFPLMVVSILVRALRWKFLINLNTHKVSFVDSCKILLVGLAMNTFMPAGFGDLAKSYFGYKWHGLKEEMVSTSLIDKLLAIASLSILTMITFFVKRSYLYLIATGISLIPLSILIFSRFKIFQCLVKKPLQRLKIIDIEIILRQIAVSMTVIVIGMVISVVGWLFTFSILYFCLKSFEIQITLPQVILISPILPIIRLFPFTLNGLGTDEAAMVYFFSNNNTNHSSIFLAAIYFRVLMLIIPAIPGMIIIWFSREK